MLKCNICGLETSPTKAQHYISRGNERTGLVTVLCEDESQLWDTFDCEWCGCQILAQRRNRAVSGDIVFDEDEKDEDEKDEEEPNDVNTITIITGEMLSGSSAYTDNADG